MVGPPDRGFEHAAILGRRGGGSRRSVLGASSNSSLLNDLAERRQGLVNALRLPGGVVSRVDHVRAELLPARPPARSRSQSTGPAKPTRSLNSLERRAASSRSQLPPQRRPASPTADVIPIGLAIQMPKTG